MSLRTRSLILVIIYSLGVVSHSEARPMRCEPLFQTTVNDVFAKISRENSDFLFQGKNLESHTQNLSWLRQRKVRALLKNANLNAFLTEKSLERYTVELSEALFGTPTGFSRWYKKSADERFEESTILDIKEQILTQGVLQVWRGTQSPQKAAFLFRAKKVLTQINDLQLSEMGQIFRIPFAIPKIEKKNLDHAAVSQELMFKIIRDGFAPHAEEARLSLQQQNLTDAYNTFRRVYSPVVLAIVLISMWWEMYEDLQKEMEARYKNVIDQLKEQSSSIEKTLPQIKQEQFEIAYTSALEEFKTVYGEPPTPAEAALLKAKIEKALKIH